MFLQTSFSLDTKAVDVLRHCETVDSSIPVTDEKKKRQAAKTKMQAALLLPFFVRNVIVLSLAATCQKILFCVMTSHNVDTKFATSRQTLVSNYNIPKDPLKLSAMFL